MDESWAEQKWQKFNSSHVKVADLRKVCTLLQFVLKIENLNRICIMARTKYIYTKNYCSFFFSFNHQCHLVRKSLVRHLSPLCQHLFHPTEIKREINITVWKIQFFVILTASNSLGVKRNFKDMRKGIIATTKNGKNKAMAELLTAHKTPSPRVWTRVNKCIFIVFT